MDHNVSTISRDINDGTDTSKIQLRELAKNCKEFNVSLFDIQHPDQGVIHVIGPELGLTLPGTAIVCGDSHTATHGAFGALAFGIGTSEVEHVLATQTLHQHVSKSMRINIDGWLQKGVTAKDVILKIIGLLGTDGGTGYVIEYAGDFIRHLSMEGRMTVCNMSIEAGAKAGMIAPDQTTFDYLIDKDHAPKGELWNQAVEHWKTLYSDDDASFDQEIQVDADKIVPQVTWGTNPGQVADVTGVVPDPQQFDDPVRKQAAHKALEYQGLKPGTPISQIPIDKVFIGSCTNGRIEDLRSAAAILKGQKVSSRVQTIVVPGSGRVKRQAEQEGLDEIFKNAGCEWRFAGCSMCLAMNSDYLQPNERCASTSNRNFEGRQGRSSRTHLVSPAMAAAAAIKGHFYDVRNWY